MKSHTYAKYASLVEIMIFSHIVNSEFTLSDLPKLLKNYSSKIFNVENQCNLSDFLKDTNINEIVLKL